MPQEINLKANQLTADETKELLNFFADQARHGIKYWVKNKVYEFNGKQFTFKNDVFQRQSKNGVRYEVISTKEPLGTGSSGVVRLIKNTFSMNGETVNYKKESRKDKSRRVVKIQDHIDESLEKEYQLSKQAFHLGIKEPTTIDFDNTTRSFIIMKRLPGKELNDIISDDIEGGRTLTLAERVALSMALLQALKKQVSERGIIHRDIKLRNILVELGPPIQVNIIDYGIGIKIGELPLICEGPPAYVAPEIFAKMPLIGVKSDVFSMGRVLARIWRGNNDTYRSYYIHLLLKYPPERLLNNLFDGLDDLDDCLKEALFNALKGMLELDPEKRSDTDKVIDEFEAINTMLSTRELNPVKPTNSNESVAQSTQLINKLLKITSPVKQVLNADSSINSHEKQTISKEVSPSPVPEKPIDAGNLSLNTNKLFANASNRDDDKAETFSRGQKQHASL